MTLRKFTALIALLCAATLFAAPMTDEARQLAFPPDIWNGPALSLGASAETMGAIVLGPGALEVGVGDEGQLAYTVDGTYGALSVDWVSSDPEIATIRPGGLVSAHSEGECIMRGVSYGGAEAEALVRVRPAPSVLIINPSAVRLGRGEAYAISPVISAGSRTSYTYKSSNAAVADVDQAGFVRARKTGSATITVRTHNGITDTLRVTVAKSPAYVRFRADLITAFVGESVAAQVKLPSGAGAIVRYFSSDPGVARVDSRGRVTGISAGEALLTAETYNGRTDEVAVVVYDPPAVILAPAFIDAVAGVPMEFPVRAETAGGAPYEGRIHIDCADPDIACVADGTLYPLKRGETYITLTAHKTSVRVPVSVSRYEEAYVTRVAAHRGGIGNGTENSLAALRGAVADGADAVEIDVRATKDGALVLMHDASINRTSYSTGFVSRMTLEQLRAVNFKGQPICTLDEALEYLSGTSAEVLLEMKAPDIEAAAVEAVARYGMAEKTTFISFSLGALSAVRAADPGARVGYLYVTDMRDPVGFAGIYSIDLMLPYAKLVDEAYVANLHNAGVMVGIWTVNKRANVRAARRAGVDYVITDRVALALGEVGR